MLKILVVQECTRQPRVDRCCLGLRRTSISLTCNPLTSLQVGDELVKNLDEMLFYLLAQDGTTSVYWVSDAFRAVTNLLLTNLAHHFSS